MANPTLQEQVHCWVQTHREDILDTLRMLVAIDTVNHMLDGNEKHGQMCVAGMLRALGCETDVYEVTSVPGIAEHPAYWKLRPCLGRPNVAGVRKGEGGGRSLLFSSHMDTVAVGPDAWTHDPFGGEISDGKLFGLGAYDMKAGLAASVMVVKALNDLGISLCGDLLVESVVDEEGGGCNGTLAARLKYNADFAILPEPTEQVLAVAHNGALILRATFRGKPGIVIGDQVPQNSTVAMARFVTFLEEWQQTARVKWPAPEVLKQYPLPFLIGQMQAGATQLPLMGDRVPSEAWLTFLIGAYPGMTCDEVFGQLQGDFQAAQANDPLLAAVLPELEIVRWLSGSEVSAEHPGVQTFATAQQAVTKRDPQIGALPAPCDAAMFNLHSSTPVLILGPKGGNAHAPDEYIVIEDYLQLVETFICGTIGWCGVASS